MQIFLLTDIMYCDVIYEMCLLMNSYPFMMQICITTTTSAGLEQILPWMFYHKVIGVATFFLFVEGKAASPEVSKVLESIPVSSLFSFL